MTDTRYRVDGLVADYCTSTRAHGPHTWPLTAETRHCPGYPAALAAAQAAARPTPCRAVAPAGSLWPDCYLPAGHAGQHETVSAYRWTT